MFSIKKNVHQGFRVFKYSLIFIEGALTLELLIKFSFETFLCKLEFFSLTLMYYRGPVLKESG